ncbi:hypothetical protein AMECASPLE_012586, partial [Ameca splendens]
PFVDGDHVLHKYFLPREYSVILPGVAAVVLLLCIGAFTAVIIVQTHVAFSRGSPLSHQITSICGEQRNSTRGFRKDISYTWPDSVFNCDTFLERGIVQASAGNNLMLTLYR